MDTSKYQWINVSNLTSDLLSCEQTSNRNSANGYRPLYQNKLINDLNNKALVFGYL